MVITTVTICASLGWGVILLVAYWPVETGLVVVGFVCLVQKHNPLIYETS